MTLTALDIETGQRYYGPCFANPKDEIPFSQRLVNPITLEPVMSVRRGHRGHGIVSAHFRCFKRQSWPEDVIEDTEYLYNGSVGESAEHMLTKEMICSQGQIISPLWEHPFATTELRVWIPFRNRYRIADVAIELPGLKMVVEVQYSKITIHELQERSNDYFEAGYDVHWVFGPSNQSAELLLWHENYIKYPAVLAAKKPVTASDTGSSSKPQSIRHTTQAQMALI